MTSALVQKLTGVRDLRKILESTVKEVGEMFSAEACQIVLSSPLDSNSTAICEYTSTAAVPPELPNVIVPLLLQGKAQGMLNICRNPAITQEELNAIRVIVGELGDIIRHAQINDVVQRTTTRDTLLVEISNLMQISLGIGDALFMVVNILGKLLNTSRTFFICTDDSQAGWKCYEFWHQGQVESAQELAWPTTDSPSVARALLANSPLVVHDGQVNSYVTPVQEELQFIGVRSLLGIPLRSEVTTHGCVILQQCDYRREWTRAEIDLVQNIADKVAEALLKLPEEKRHREPIMQLHQRIVAPAEGNGDKQTIGSVRRALKGALGAQAIPSAQKTAAARAQAKGPLAAQSTSPAGQPGGKNLGSVLGGIKAGAAAAAAAALDVGVPSKPEMPPAGAHMQAAADGATWTAPQERRPELEPDWSEFEPDKAVADSPSKWGDLEAIPTPGASRDAVKWGDLDAIAAPGAAAGTRGDLDAIAAPGTGGGAAGRWGNLDAIPTPANAGAGGLSGRLGKNRGPQLASPLMASFHRDKTRFTQQMAVADEEQPAPAPAPVDERAAQAKLKAILSTSNPTSDYIFATEGMDARILGRIDGWVSQIEEKDKYALGHARPVAMYACAIAAQLGLTPQEVNLIRLAALAHDVGKLGAAPQILQKRDEELTDAELLMIMKHPLDGAELLESFPDLKHLAPIVRAHHEEFDGNGYPAGLKGEDIPLAARIISCADSYHLMTSTMRWGPGRSPQEAQQALAQGAGRQWDPRVVEALILCLMQQKVPAVFDGSV